jgi:hypothetical protein
VGRKKIQSRICAGAGPYRGPERGQRHGEGDPTHSLRQPSEQELL